MNRLDSMSVLVAVVEAGSLSAASRKLKMPLPTVSRKVSELETHVGARLLIRSTRKLTLTEAGEAYVAACRRILEDVAEAERGASGEYSAPKGELTVTAPIVFGRVHVLPVTAEFLKAYPDVDVRLVLADRLLNLQDEHLDVALRIGELPDSSLVAMRVGETPISRSVARRKTLRISRSMIASCSPDSWARRTGRSPTLALNGHSPSMRASSSIRPRLPSMQRSPPSG